MSSSAYEQVMADGATSIGAAPPLTAAVAGHQLEVIVSGSERFKRMLAMIGSAKQSIDLIFYIFAADATGRAVLAALIAAAERGVAVRCVIDSFGSSETPDSFFNALCASGGTVTFFSRRWRSSYLIRNHQKLLIVDGATAMTGGFNIADAYMTDHGADHWLDLAVMVTGPSVAKMTRWFGAMDDYARLHDGKLLRLRRLIREWRVEQGPVEWLVGGPTQRLSPWARRVRTDLQSARQIDMVMAYFSPGQGMLRRIRRVAPRGRARLILAAKSDNAATIGASRLLYGYLLRKGVTIAEYQPSRLHMKLIIVDDIVYLGSPNFDMRSLFLNVELSLRIADAGFARQMRDLVDVLQGDCEPITKELHKQRAGWLTRIRWTLAWFVVGAVDYTVARRLNFGLGARD